MRTKQTKIDRSAARWLPGAMALAATTASSQAAIVQITLTGNNVTSTGVSLLVADLTGDYVADIAIASDMGNVGDGYGMAIVVINGMVLSAQFAVGVGYLRNARFAFGGLGTGSEAGVPAGSISYLNPITFTDYRINNNTTTGGWLQVNAFNTSATSHTVELARLIFDDANTTRPSFGSIPDVQTAWVAAVPEPGSHLALLALGAGGLTLRRRLKRMA